MACGLVRLVRAWLALVLAASILAASATLLVGRAGELPWGPLRSLDDPAGRYTAAKLARLSADPGACRELLARAGVTVREVPLRRADPACRVVDAVTIGDAGPALAPARPPLSCPLAAALVMWERQVVQPAARARLGVRVTAIDHLGSYSCRRIGGSAGGDWSEHARANALDVAGFTFADGRRIRVATGWHGTDAAFLRQVRDGGCGLFATVLSPDYNAAHRDHLHLDEAARGGWGWRVCR